MGELKEKNTKSQLLKGMGKLEHDVLVEIMQGTRAAMENNLAALQNDGPGILLRPTFLSAFKVYVSEN